MRLLVPADTLFMTALIAGNQPRDARLRCAQNLRIIGAAVQVLTRRTFAVRRHGGPLPSVLGSPVNRPFLGAIGGLDGDHDGKTAGGISKRDMRYI